MFSRCLFYFVVVCLCFFYFIIIYFSFTFLRYILISIYSDIDQPSLFSIKYISNKPCLHKIRFSGKIYIVPEIIDLRKLKEYISYFQSLLFTVKPVQAGFINHSTSQVASWLGRKPRYMQQVAIHQKQPIYYLNFLRTKDSYRNGRNTPTPLKI